MSKRVIVNRWKEFASPMVANYIIDWCVENPESGLGGATGRSPIDVWRWVWRLLESERAKDRDAVVGQKIAFLDEYFGAYASYYHWAWRNLLVGRDGLAPDNVNVPRGCFFEEGRIVTSERLEELLDDEECRDDWQGFTLPGEDGGMPEVRFDQDKPEEDMHPVLAQIRTALSDYDAVVRGFGKRLQLLGIGVGGAIEKDPDAGGHIGFVECGAAAKDSKTMLVRLARSTSRANKDDFLLENADGDTRLEPSQFAITQGISTVLSAGELLMMAWGGSKQLAVERMFLGEPGPKNPAAWVQEHANVTVFLDQGAYGSLKESDLDAGGWSVEFHEMPVARVAPNLMG